MNGLCSTSHVELREGVGKRQENQHHLGLRERIVKDSDSLEETRILHEERESSGKIVMDIRGTGRSKWIEDFDITSNIRIDYIARTEIDIGQISMSEDFDITSDIRIDDIMWREDIVSRITIVQ